MTPEEAQAVDKVRSTFDELDCYRAQVQTPFVPKATSKLSRSDAAWTLLPASQHVHASLAAAYDHLDLIRLTIEQRRGFATATYSVSRGALLSASQALWLLAIDETDATRVERGLMFSEEWYVQRIRWQELMTPDLANADDAAKSGEQLRRFDEDLARLRSLRTTKARMNSTAIVEEAARMIHPDSPLLQRSTVREWRRTGGDAHGLGWPLMTQSVVWGERGGDGLTGAVAEVDLVSLANAYLAAWLVLKRGFKEASEAASAED